MKKEKDKRFKVFISYAYEDLPEARSIANSCQKIGLSTWMDEKEIKSGEKWREQLNHAIEECDFAIVLISKEALNSKYITREWDVLCEKKWNRPDITILPIKWDNVKTPPFLCEYRDILFKNKELDYRQLEEYLVRLLKQKVGDTHEVVGSKNIAEEVKRLKNRVKSIQSSLIEVESHGQGGQPDDQA